MIRRLASVCIAFCLALVSAVPAGQDYSGANQSNDPCYKIKQLKLYTRNQPGYKQSAGGDRDPAYIQCHPLTITTQWEIEDVETSVIGTDRADLALTEEYPAYLMVHYGWFDGLKQKKPKSYDLVGPEPCWVPCPGRVRSELVFLNGQVVCCLDQPLCQKKKTVNLQHTSFQMVPSDTETQYAWLRFQRDIRFGVCEGEIRTSRLVLDRSQVTKGCGRFWDPFHYRIKIDQPPIDSAGTRSVSGQGLPTFAELEEGLRTGVLTKVYSFSVHDPILFPGQSKTSLVGKVTVTMAFAPIEEERWRITVWAWEKDNTQPPFLYTEKGVEKKVPIWVEMNHNLTAEVVLNKTKTGRTFKSGSVLSYSNTPAVHGAAADICKCDFVPCPESPGAYAGAALAGSVDGPNLTLDWPEDRDQTRVCLMCKSLKSYLKAKPYREKFGAGELIDELHRTVLPLKNGYTKSGKILDWMKYTITLTKVK